MAVELKAEMAKAAIAVVRVVVALVQEVVASAVQAQEGHMAVAEMPCSASRPNSKAVRAQASRLAGKTWCSQQRWQR